jgi:drug/metabolite transporter (DMT)-like permease
MTRERQGIALCLVSACGFGALGILAKEAYAAGIALTTLLALRFAVSAALLWGVVAVRRTPLRAAARPLAIGGLLGLAGFSNQAALYLGSLERIDAGLAALLLYAYPAFVTVGALALGRERPTARRWFALLVASLGLVLVLGAGGLAADPLGAAMALGSGLVYSGFILVSDTVVRDVHPVAFTAAVCTGCTVAFAGATVVTGGPELDFGAGGWVLVVAIAVVSTVVPIVAFFAGLDRVGPSRASILSTVEPPVAVLLAFLVFGETLGWLQLAGGALVLSGAVLVVEQLDADGGRERAGQVEDVGPAHAGAAQPVRAAQAGEPAALEGGALQPRP